MYLTLVCLIIDPDMEMVFAAEAQPVDEDESGGVTPITPAAVVSISCMCFSRLACFLCMHPIVFTPLFFAYHTTLIVLDLISTLTLHRILAQVKKKTRAVSLRKHQTKISRRRLTVR